MTFGKKTAGTDIEELTAAHSRQPLLVSLVGEELTAAHSRQPLLVSLVREAAAYG